MMYFIDTAHEAVGGVTWITAGQINLENKQTGVSHRREWSYTRAGLSNTKSFCETIAAVRDLIAFGTGLATVRIRRTTGRTTFLERTAAVRYCYYVPIVLTTMRLPEKRPVATGRHETCRD